MASSKVKEPVMMEAKNAEIYVSRFGSYINDASINDLFLKWLGEGYHTANVTISVIPIDPQTTTITTGGKTVDVENLRDYVEEEQDEQFTESNETPDPEE